MCYSLTYLSTFLFLKNDENEDLDRHTSLNSNSDRGNIATDPLFDSHVYSCRAFVFHICIAYQRCIQITIVVIYGFIKQFTNSLCPHRLLKGDYDNVFHNNHTYIL